MCMCVCVRVYVCVCVCVSVYACVCLCVFKCLYRWSRIQLANIVFTKLYKKRIIFLIIK